MGNKKNQSKQMKNENKDYSVFKTVLFYCLLVITLPLITFWSLKSFVFEDYLNLDPVKSNIYSAIAAVIALHLALGLYIYRAYFDGDQAASYKKQE